VPIFEHNGKYGLFVHIPKTGGKSVTEYLKNAGCRLSLIDHPPKYRWKANTRHTLKARAAWEVSCELLQEHVLHHGTHSWHLPVSPQHVQGDILESSLKLDKISWIFTMIRDPVERSVSRYKSAVKKGSAKGKDVMISRDTFFANANMKADFYNWIKGSQKQWKKNPYYADNHFRPQVDFIVPRCRVFTYPHYDELINYLEVEVGLPKSEFQTLGASEGPAPPISTKSERLIREWYHNDYEFLKKTFYKKILHLS